MAFAASQVRPVFFDARALREVSELPLLGVVSRTLSVADVARERTRFRQFIGGVLAFFGAYGAGLALLSFLATRTA